MAMRSLAALSLLIPLAGATLPSESDPVCKGDGQSAQACDPAPRSDKGMVLLQHGSSNRRVVVPPLELVEVEDPVTILPEHGPLPLCHSSIVRATCRRMNGGTRARTVSKDKIQELLSTNRSTVRGLWAALRLTDEEVPCARLCSSIVRYVRRKGVLPRTSDRGCYTVNGKTNCTVDVSPHKLVTSLSDTRGLRPDGGPEELPDPADGLAEGLVQHSERLPEGLVQHRIVATADGARSVRRGAALAQSAGDEGTQRPRRKFCPYSLWASVELLANFFRIFPSSGSDLIISGPPASLAQVVGGAGATAAESIASDNVQAKAWVSAVVLELANQNTGPFRDEWFGGSGSMSKADVRARIVLAMNFIERELDTVRYVYPADSASSTACSGNTVAYVWKWQTNNQGYEETQGPVCSSSDDPMQKRCAVDNNGMYYVYLCQLWYTSQESWRIATLVHEVAHHTGPGDVSYDRSAMKQLTQSQQLDNAANYQHFAQSVAYSAWGCDDNDPPVFSFSCNPGPCQCANLASYCDSGTYGAQVQAQCAGTCGQCSNKPAPAPAPAPTPAPAPAPSPTPGSTPAPVTPAPPTPAPATPAPATPAPATPSPATPAPATPSPATPAPTPTPLTPSPAPPGGAPWPAGMGCQEETGTQQIALGGKTYSGSCDAFKFYGHCTKANVKATCPVTCGLCVAGMVWPISS